MLCYTTSTLAWLVDLVCNTWASLRKGTLVSISVLFLGGRRSRSWHLACCGRRCPAGAHPGWSAAPTSLCPPVWGRRGQTRFVRCALCAQTVAASQTKMRALARPAPDGRTQPPRKIAPTGQRLPQQQVNRYSNGDAPTPLLPRRVRSGRSAPCEVPRSAVGVAARAARFVD